MRKIFIITGAYGETVTRASEANARKKLIDLTLEMIAANGARDTLAGHRCYKEAREAMFTNEPKAITIYDRSVGYSVSEGA